jgi:putative transposase
MRKTYKYRLYPTLRQAEMLNTQLAEACRLYNAALQERRDAWKIERKSTSLYSQAYQLKDIFAAGDSGIRGYNVAWHVLDRVDKSFKAFFRRVKRGEKAGFPRFRSARRYDSFNWQADSMTSKTLTAQSKLHIPKIGGFKLKLHRPVEGKIKHCHVKRSAGRWYACLSVECDAKPLPECSEKIGIDVGLSSFATLSDGTGIDNPRWYRKAQARFRRVQRRVARRKKGSHGRSKAVLHFQRAHECIRNQRSDFHHKISRRMVNDHGLIAVEDLKLKDLGRSRLAKSITDAGWGMFLDKIAYKAEEAGRKFFRVNPSGTSQNCSGCGHKQIKTLSERMHKCDSCGLKLNRDHNAAINILRAGIALAALTCPVRESVAAENASTQAPVRRTVKKSRPADRCLDTIKPNASG